MRANGHHRDAALHKLQFSYQATGIRYARREETKSTFEVSK